MFAESLGQFFDTSGGFAQSATFGAQTGAVILDSPTEDALGGRVASNEYAAVMPAATFPALVRGSTITVAGVQYTVRQVRLLDDGALKEAILTKV